MNNLDRQIVPKLVMDQSVPVTGALKRPLAQRDSKTR